VDVLDAHDNDLFHGMIYPEIEDKPIGHDLRDFSSIGVKRVEIWHNEGVGRQFTNPIQNPLLGALRQANQKTRLLPRQRPPYNPNG